MGGDIVGIGVVVFFVLLALPDLRECFINWYS
jgi:hypothetical protein